MIRKLNIERLLCICMMLIAGIALYGTRELPLEARYTLGPGAAPLFYSLLLIISSSAVFFMAGNLRPMSFKSLISGQGSRGALLFVMFIGLSGLVYVLGFMVSILLFTFAGLVLIEDWAYPKALLFSIAWTFVLHLIFVRFLAARLIRGFLF